MNFNLYDDKVPTVICEAADILDKININFKARETIFIAICNKTTNTQN